MQNDPFEALKPLREGMNRLSEESFIGTGSFAVLGGLFFPINVYELEDKQGFVIDAALPGVQPEDIEITAVGNTLTIRAIAKERQREEKETYERREPYEGEKYRSVTLPSVIDASKAKATYEHSVLTLHVPKAQEARPKQEPIQRKASIAQRRFVNVCLVNHEDQTIVSKTTNLGMGRTYDLRLDIGPLSPDSVVENAGENPFPEELLPATEDGHWVEVIVVSDDFSVSEQRYSLFLPKLGSSWVCGCTPGGGHKCDKDLRNSYLFIPLLAPERTGSARLRIAIYYCKNLVQSQILTAHVSNGKLKKNGYSSRIDYTLTAHLQDVSFLQPRNLHILTNQNVDGAHRIIVNGRMADIIVCTFAEDAIGSAIKKVREALCNVHFKEGPAAWGSTLPPPRTNLLNKNNGKSPEEFIEDLKRLAPLGWELWNMVLGKQKKWWKELLEPATIQVSRTGSSTFIFPWASVYDIPLEAYGRYENCPLVKKWDGVSPLVDSSMRRCPYESEHQQKNTLCPFGFWGIKHIIEQPPSMPQGRNLPLVIRIANDPPKLVAGFSLSLDPKLTMAHLQNLELTHFQISKYASLNEIVSALKGQIEIVYFYCHGGRVRTESDQQTPFLEVGKNERFRPTDIAAWQRADWPEDHWEDTSPLVVINGCHTTELTPELLVNFVDAFTNAYAAGVIGTEITLDQSVASEAALQFFSHFQKNGMNVGQALRYMRTNFLMKGNLLGLAYTPYCSADLHI